MKSHIYNEWENLIRVLMCRHQAGRGGADWPAAAAGRPVPPARPPDPAPGPRQEVSRHRPRGDPREERRHGLRQAPGVRPGR